MSELKKYTRLGSNSRQLAALLQAKAPKGHMLAYINPREAALLKAHGGSGHEHADTGIPSYEDGGDDYGVSNYQQEFADLYPAQTEGAIGTTFTPEGRALSGGISPETGGVYLPTDYAAPSVPAPATTGVGEFSRGTGAPEPLPLNEFGQAYRPVESLTAARDMAEARAATEAPLPPGAPGAAPEEKSMFSKDTLMRLGLAGALGYLGSRQAKKAGEQGQAGKAEMQQLATPYQRAGTEMQQKAQRGELMPVGQQAMQAAQAQAAQDIQRRGGVGAQQAQQQMVNLRQQLLQQQYDYGLKLSGIGDNIALGAIRTGLQADQYVNQLTNNFYSNMAYIASGMAPGTRTAGGQ